MKIIRDEKMNEDSHVVVLEVKYPDPGTWDIEAFERMRDAELEAVLREGAEYDRETWFRQDPYFRYFRKFRKTYPVMMQVESFLLKGRPFPEGRYVNAVAFLTELRTRALLGTHDGEKVAGDIVFYTETAKTPFPSIHGGDAHSYPGDVTGRDDEGIIISMIGGVDARTCISDDSRHALYFVFGTPGMTVEELSAHLDTAEGYAKVLAPDAEMKRYIV